MGAPDLLHRLRGAGLLLTVTPTGELQVAPSGADRRLEPVPTIPQLCPGFTLAHGLT